jgi:hypothetical protein
MSEGFGSIGVSNRRYIWSNTPMNESELWAVVSEPLPLRKYRSRALSARMFCVIAVMVIVGVALWAVN